MFLGLILIIMFQSLSGLTLCCDQIRTAMAESGSKSFQSLSGLTLCCDAYPARLRHGIL